MESQSFQPTKAQEAAFKKVVAAFKAARKAGLTFYGNGDSLVAYTAQAMEYVNRHTYHVVCHSRGHSQLPGLLAVGCLADSGADDPPHFLTAEDAERHG